MALGLVYPSAFKRQMASASAMPLTNGPGSYSARQQICEPFRPLHRLCGVLGPLLISIGSCGWEWAVSSCYIQLLAGATRRRVEHDRGLQVATRGHIDLVQPDRAYSFRSKGPSRCASGVCRPSAIVIPLCHDDHAASQQFVYHPVKDMPIGVHARRLTWQMGRPSDVQDSWAAALSYPRRHSFPPHQRSSQLTTS